MMPASSVRRHETAINRTPAEAVRVLQVTDPHLFAESQGALRGTVTDASLAAVLSHVADSDWRADFVALTGDLIQDDSREAYARVRAHFLPLGLPILCVPGNHDVRALMREALSDEPFRYCGRIRAGDWLIVGADSCKSGSAGGEVAPAERERVAAAIAASDAAHVLVCLHHPPLPMGSRWLDRVGLDGGSEFLDLLADAGKVRACLFGHVHQAFDGEYRGLRVIGTPSTCRQFLPGSDDFAVDDRPPAYRRVELLADGRMEDELVWVPGAAPAA